MPSKLRKAIGAVKDQTSISLAKVSNANASNLEVAILKATKHDEVPVDERYVNEVLSLISSNKIYAASCAQTIAKRIGKTRNWIVALKSLMLVLRIFQDGDPYFPKEVLLAMKRGAKILNISNFRDDSHSKPWDYTAFVRTFALYLDERLDCFLTGKLQRRFTNRERENSHPISRSRRANDSVSEMKPAMLLDRLTYWQKLLDRAVATKPTGAAKTNRMVQVSLYAIVQESFDLYRDISDGLALLLDSFFQLHHQYGLNGFQICFKASKQFEELCSFYDLCKSLGVGRTSEYPSMQKISEELIETLQEFLKDQSSFPTNGRSPALLLLPAPPNDDASSRCDESSEPNERFSDRRSEFGSQCTSLEDLMSATDMGASPPMTSMDHYLEQFEKRSQTEDILSNSDSNSIRSFTVDQGTISGANSTLDLVSLDGWPPEDQQLEQEQLQLGQQTSVSDSNTGQRDCNWEVVLAETASQSLQASPDLTIGYESNALSNFFDQDSALVVSGFESRIANNTFDQDSLAGHQCNPFLQDTTEVPAIVAPPESQTVCAVNDTFQMGPTFQATPTFSYQNPDTVAGLHNEDDPFAPCVTTMAAGHKSNVTMDQQSTLQQQQLWLQQQDRIIAKNMS